MTPFVVVFKPSGKHGRKVLSWTRYYRNAADAHADIPLAVTREYPRAMISSINAAEQFSERYLAYCAENGRTPAEQLAADTIAYPGGKMCGFIVWCSKNEVRS